MPERERVDTGTNERYVRRDDEGQFTKDQTDVGRSSARDQQQHSSTPSRRGEGDRGDRPKGRSLTDAVDPAEAASRRRGPLRHDRVRRPEAEVC